MMSANTTAAIDNLATTMGDVFLLIALLLIPLGLTVAMFLSKEMMLGFPATLFWAIFGGYCYTQSEVAWGDIYYYLAFGSLLGMTVFTAFAAYGLRERRETIAEEEFEEGEPQRIGEEPGKKDETETIFSIEGEAEPSARTKAVRQRARARKTRRQW